MTSYQFILNTVLTHNKLDIVDVKAHDIVSKKKVSLSLNIFDSDSDSDSDFENSKNKKTLIFIHGNSASKKVFSSQFFYFRQEYRIIAIDLLGHGDSTKISAIENLSATEKEILSMEFYNPLAMLKQIEQVLEFKKIKKAHFIGWSLGGHLAYGVGADRPDLVDRIITLGSPPVRFSEIGFQQGFHEYFVKTLIPQWLEKPEQFSLEVAKSIAESMGYTDSEFINDLMISDPLMRKYLFYNMKKYDESFYDVLDGHNFIKSTNNTILIIVGENDSGVNSEFFKKLKFNLKFKNNSSAILIMKNAGHALFLTHASEYYAMIDTVLKSTPEQPQLLRARM